MKTKDSWSQIRQRWSGVQSPCVFIIAQKIGHLTFVSHGNYDNFRIGKEVVHENYLLPGYREAETGSIEKQSIYYSLQSLKPYFDQRAIVVLQACRCGAGETLLKTLSALLGVAVTGWTGDVTFEYGFFSKGIEYSPGNMVVCKGNLCITH